MTRSSLAETAAHSVVATALSMAVATDWLERAASSISIACISAVCVHFLKLWLDKRKK